MLDYDEAQLVRMSFVDITHPDSIFSLKNEPGGGSEATRH